MRMPKCVKPPGIRFALWMAPLLAFACAKAPEHSGKRSIPDRYVEGSFVVAADVTTSEERIKQLSSDVASALGCKAKEPTRINWGDTSEDGIGALSQSLLNTFNLTFENCDFSRDGTKAIVSGLAGSEGVLSAEPEALATASPIQENDPDKAQQGHLPFIRRDQACSIAEKSSKPVIVAVVDSGVQVDHPDLAGMILRDSNGAIVGANFVGSGAQMPPDDQYGDPNGHGTHVAGLIGAQANNGKGVVGVASCANVKIMPVRVLNDVGTGSSLEIERGVKWAIDHGAQIINMSLGYMTTLDDASNGYFNRPLYNTAVAKNVMVFAAAGNDGLTMGAPAEKGGLQYHFPSSYNGIVAVAATNNQGQLTSFSNRGDRVDIAAPGYSVLATTHDGSYGRKSGTSMASPVAAGAYALALSTALAGIDSDRVDVAIAQGMLQQATLDGATNLGSAAVKAGKAIDVEKLVAAMKAQFPKPTAPTQPVTQPSQPSQPQPVVSPTPAQPEPKAFAFTGVKNGGTAGWPQRLAVENLPAGTYVVYFYWGSSPWSFSKAYAKNGKAVDEDSWYLYGYRKLTAVAYSYYGRELGTVSVTLKGH
jgi:subtilisin family serine protease